MTATPIPRSLALTNYGDMELSEVDEKPIGRKPINTVMVSSSRILEVIDRLKVAIETGNQIYWVCPLVEESEFLELTSAEDRANNLSKVLGKNNIGLVHGKMSGGLDGRELDVGCFFECRAPNDGTKSLS